MIVYQNNSVLTTLSCEKCVSGTRNLRNSEELPTPRVERVGFALLLSDFTYFSAPYQESFQLSFSVLVCYRYIVLIFSLR
jgi:hypothetical protein